RSVARCPVGVAAEGGQQTILLVGVGGHARAVAYQLVAPVVVDPPGEPAGAHAHRIRVEPRVGADRHRQIPAVYEVFGEELPDVLGGRGRAGRQVHGAVDGAGMDDGDLGLCGRLPCRRDRIRAELVTVEAVADLVDGAAGEQGNAPPVLADDVVDQGADVPVRARCLLGPLAGPDLVHPVDELGQAPAVRLQQVHAVD